MKVPHDDNQPHSAVLWIEAKIYDERPTGELSGNVVTKIDRFVLQIRGSDRHLCERKLNDVLAELKQKCQN